MSIGGPLFMLKWQGGVCPCMEKGEDKGARLALEYLGGMMVRWHRTGVIKSVSGLMSGWFGNNSQQDQQGPGANKDAVDAMLIFKDTEKGPVLCIQPQAEQQTGTDGEITLKKSAGYSKTIPLHHVNKILIKDESFVVLQHQKDGGKYQDIVTLEVLTGDTAEQVKDALQELHDFEERRRAAIPEEDRELDEEQGIKAKAQKAAHFAKREIELQKTKREREKRKAALVKETGGLKYTALAMANRMD